MIVAEFWDELSVRRLAQVLFTSVVDILYSLIVGKPKSTVQ